MSSVLPAADDVWAAYLEATGEWGGCDWPTEFGEGDLDLNGLRASQAALLARATAGREAQDWRAAARWLAEVEEQAAEADREAWSAVLLAFDGRSGEALEHARRACAIEARYHAAPVWQRLCDALETISSASA